MLSSKKMSSISLMDCQKESILSMLNIEGTDTLSDLTNKKKKKKSSSSSHMGDHVVTGHELGHQLTERKVQQWKVLVMDKHCFEIIAPLFKVGDLRAMGVTLVLPIEEKRQPIPDAPAIYFVQPTQSNIDLICEDCENELYASCHINFCHSNYKRDILEKMAMRLVQSETTNLLKKVLDQFVNFLCLEKDFFSLLGLENCMIHLHDPTKKEEEIKSTIDQIANGVASVVLSYSSGKSSGFIMPFIVCPSSQGQPARLIAEAVEKILRSLAQSSLHDAQSESNVATIEKKKSRPLLVITDRTIDLTVCLQHQWTYRSMVFDLFQMKSNQVKVPLKKKSTAASATEQTYEIALDDEFWIENSSKPFQEVAQNVTGNLERHKARFNEFNKKNGLNLSEDDVMNTDAGENAQLSKETIDEMFKLAEERKQVDMHTNIAYAILHEVNKRKLDEFVAIEEAIIRRQNKIETPILHSLLNISSQEEGSLEQEKGTIKDKLRLILVCYLYIIQQERMNQAPQIITRQELEKYALALFQRRNAVENKLDEKTPSSLETALPELSFLKQITMHTNMGRVTQQPHVTHQSSLANLTKKFSILGEKISSIASGLNEYYGEGSEYSSTLPLTRIVDAIVSNTPKKLYEHEEFVFIDPKLPPSQSVIKTLSKSSVESSNRDINNPSSPRGRGMDETTAFSPSSSSQEGFSEVITFVVGGGNYMEYQNLIQHFNAKSIKTGSTFNVTYGSTDILTGEQFLEELRLLGEKTRR
ncbi:hypothetical protein C9374_010348 [Naegleria lovaniensis]|uniref:Uncharacterized protein n=1 Tax=Naegleria lovaniensis TaxID=51637 RepID=A0AA88KG27_NAELO|nr:uncharacterized protein C9374_010348 [Naegleria lovaniensis]KAG2374974.1 hypothetical protein C9374_010348 [Naegleria lovaniensis]